MINVLFDVDGTLWDSAEPVAQSWNEVLRRHPEIPDLPAFTKEDMYRQMGKTMDAIGLSVLPDLNDRQRNQIMQECMDHENEYLYSHPGVFYPGLEETLESLKDLCRFYVVSNCQDGYIQAMLSHGNLKSLISDFECFGRTHLPKEGSIRILMERNGIAAEDAVYVGDTHMDETAARGAGIRFIHAAYGFGSAEHPDGVIKSIRELPGALDILKEKE